MEGKRGTGWPGVVDLVNAHTRLSRGNTEDNGLLAFHSAFSRSLALFSFSLIVVGFR